MLHALLYSVYGLGKPLKTRSGCSSVLPEEQCSTGSRCWGKVGKLAFLKFGYNRCHLSILLQLSNLKIREVGLQASVLLQD